MPAGAGLRTQGSDGQAGPAATLGPVVAGTTPGLELVGQHQPGLLLQEAGGARGLLYARVHGSRGHGAGHIVEWGNSS